MPHLRERAVLIVTCLAAMLLIVTAVAKAQPAPSDSSPQPSPPSQPSPPLPALPPPPPHPAAAPSPQPSMQGVPPFSDGRPEGAPPPRSFYYPGPVGPFVATSSAAFPPPAPPRAPLGLTASLGVRSDLVRSSALDPFSTTDDVNQSALAIGYRFGDAERAGIALGFEWNHGSTDATARDGDATLTIDRLSLGFEGRLPVARRLSAFARLAPGLLRHHAQLRDASAPAAAYGAPTPSTLQQTAWLPTADVSGGLAYRVGSLRAAGATVFAFWLAAEGGYGYSAARELVLGPGVETQAGRVDEPLRLGTFAYRGAFLRFQFSVAF